MRRKVLKVPDRLFAKYNTPTCIKVEFIPEGFNALREKYHDINGQPGFINALLHLDPELTDIQLFKKHPQLIQWSADGTILFCPNLPQVDLKILSEAPQKLKNAAAGLSVAAWYIHPRQLEHTVFSQKPNRDDFRNTMASIAYVKDASPKMKFTRSPYQNKIRATELETGKPYLASLLDLRPEHLPWLKELKRMTLNHLGKQYGVNGSDHVALYFHKITDPETTTLHLHIRVNQGMSPMEKTQSIMLDDIIDAFQKDVPIQDFYMQPGAYYMSPGKVHKRKLLESIPGVKLMELENPFLMTTPFVPVEQNGAKR